MLKGATCQTTMRSEAEHPFVESRDDMISAEYDADAKQDEILFKAGVYEMPSRRSLVWKFFVIFGVVVLLLGLVFWARIGGLRFPDLSFVPGALMPLMSIFLALLGLVCLIAGVALGMAYRRDPYEMRPIR